MGDQRVSTNYMSRIHGQKVMVFNVWTTNK